jgi:hypothetical protein
VTSDDLSRRLRDLDAALRAVEPALNRLRGTMAELELLASAPEV